MTWQGSLYATHSNFQKGSTDAIMRKSAWLAMLNEFGKISLNEDGEDLTWRLEFAQPETFNLDDTTMRVRTRKNTLKPVTVPWAFYECTDTISQSDVLKNKGPNAIVKLQDLKQKGVVKSLRAKLAHDFYIDGKLVELKLMGAESWGAYGSAQAGPNGVFAPNDTYGGLSTALQAQGGAAPVGGAWPDGVTEDPEYDCHSPLILSSTSTAFGPDATWAANCLTILSKAFAWAMRNEGVINTALMTTSYWQALASILENKDRVVLADTARLVKYGFSQGVVNYYGMECVADYWAGITSTSAKVLGVCWEETELLSLHPQLFPATSEDEFFADDSINYKARFAGQMKYRTLRNQVKIAELGS